MWIVQIALRRPYTFVVMALVILLAGGVAIARMPADIFPDINIPVISVVWQYSGLAPEELADIAATRSERAFTTTVNDIEHIESQTVSGFSVVKLFFHPSAKVEAAMAQSTAQAATLLGFMPEGARPPNILRYNAASVPILQLGLSSETLSEQEIQDIGNNFIRNQLATIQGSSVPPPSGGKQRNIMVDLDPPALFSRGLSAQDVSAAISAQNPILPGGTAKFGAREYRVELNNNPSVVDQFNRIPVRTTPNGTTYVRDVAQVHDGFTVQQNIVRHDGQRGALLSIMKSGGASTLDIVKRVKETLPRIKTTLPAGLTITPLLDQSVFVNASISGVVKEAGIAALLTGLMILVFLGSWRSTVIVCLSIPLSILSSLAILWAFDQTINIMTLGGMALAVGILVDDATVTIENIHRNLELGKKLIPAILDGAQQIALPAFVSTLCICIVFVPVTFLSGVSKYLFVPLAAAVVLAMAASYLLSRTLVPTLANFLLHAHVEHEHSKPSLFQRAFDKFQDVYVDILDSALHHRWLVLIGFVAIVGASVMLYPLVGQDFFPSVDAGQIRLHVRAASGTRIEETEQEVASIEETIRRIIPREELASVLDNIGTPTQPVNYAMGDNAAVGPADAEVLLSLSPEHHATADYIREMRKRLPIEFPSSTFFFQPADIVSQILNFGLPAPIDIQIAGPLRNADKNYLAAVEIADRLRRVPGTADIHLGQIRDIPLLKVEVDHDRAAQLGFTQRDVAGGMLISLVGTAQVGVNYWVNQANGVIYNVVAQTPQSRLTSIEQVLNTPIHPPGGASTQLLGNVAHVSRGLTSAVVSHYNAQPVFDVFANVQDRDLGGVAEDTTKILAEYQKKLPAGSFIEMRGQVGTMRESFTGMMYGLIFAIILVYFVMVVNFQSWVDPFIILTGIPGTLTGILLILFFTHTTVSVPALMGAIMSIGVGTANSILLVTFANDCRKEGLSAMAAAIAAGGTRLRPVVMTAAAMLVGMIPMAMGLGEGGEQNAPLGRAVIGGLLLATIATLFVVPVVYSLLRRTPPKNFENLESA